MTDVATRTAVGPLRYREFRWILVATSGSTLGSWLLTVVLGIWVKDLTGSNAMAASVVFAGALPAFAAPLAGLLVDRLPRRTFLVATNLALAVLICALFAVHGRGDVWIVYAVALAEGFGGGVLSAGVNALNRTVLPPESLGRANALLATVRQTLQLLGPALGALLYAGAGAHIVVLLDVVTFVLSAGCLARCVLPGPSTPEGADSSLKESALEGVRHVSRNPYLRHLLLTGAIFGLSIGFSEAIVFAVAQGVGRPAAFAGVLTSTEAVGSIGMGVLLSAVGAPLRELGKITAGLGCFACGMLLQTAGGLPLVLAGCVLVGAGSPLLVVGVTTAAQRRTPAALSGRLSGALGFAINVPFAFSIGLGAVLVGLVPYQVLLAGMSCGLILAACYALLTLREPAGRPDE